MPDIAAGDVLGSCVFNTLILAFLDAIYKPMPISAKAHHGHILSAGFGILLLSIIVIGLFLGNRITPLGWIGPYSLIVPVIYFAAMRLLFVYEKRRIAGFVKEMVVSISAVKMGAIDLAVGNLFGSNIFNMFILAIDDMFFVKGPILSFVNANHIISALSAILMTAIAIIGLTYRSEKKKLLLAWDSIGILLVFIANLIKRIPRSSASG